MKCATEREKDRTDVLSLIEKFNIRWDIVIEESIHQTRLGEDVFPIYLYDFLLELKDDLKADIPKQVLTEIRRISEQEMIKALKKKKSTARGDKKSR